VVIKGYDAGVLARKTFSEVWKDNVLGLSAQAAYSFFFSLFPILLFLAPLFSLVGNKQVLISKLLARLSVTLPADAYALLSGIVADVVFNKNAPGLISIGILLAVFSGSAVIDTLMAALNTAYDAHDPRPWWKKRLIAFAFTIGSGIVIGVSTMVLMGGESIINFIAKFAHIPGDTRQFWTIAQYPLALMLLTGMIWLLFYLLPYVKQSKLHVLAGAVVTVMLWIVITLIFRWYVTNFGSYNKTYGTIGGVIILLTWMYWTMCAFLIGGELNSELHAGTGKVGAPVSRLPSEALRDAAIAEKARF
jgi:membrane protein